MAEAKMSSWEEIAPYLEVPKSNFCFALNSQQCSRLVQCPAEIRSIILRMLLHVDELSEAVQLSSQLLRTCQILYKEARDILYCSNTLQVVAKPPSKYYELFDIEFPAMVVRMGLCGQFYDIFDEAGDVGFQCVFHEWIPQPIFDEVMWRLENWVELPAINDLPSDQRLLGVYVHFLKLYRAIELFDTVHIRIDELRNHWIQYDSKPIFFCLRSLAKLCQNKHVLLDLTTHTPMSELHALEILQMCRNIRCKSINIRLPHSVASFPDVKSLGLKVKALVESNKPVYDTWEMAIELRQQISEWFDAWSSGLNLRELEDNVHLAFIKLHDDSRFCEPTIYEARRSRVLKAIERRIGSSLKGQIGHDIDEAKEAQKIAKRMRQHLKALT